MYFSEKEKETVKTFYKNIDEYEKNTMTLRWNNNSQATATFDTCFESDNELDMDNTEYEEYVSFIFKLIEVLGKPPIYITEDKFFCIDYHNFPDEILVSGKKIN